MADVSFTGLKAREYVAGLWAGMGRIIDPHRTVRGWFHYPRAFLPTFVILAIAVLLRTAFGVQYGLVPGLLVPYVFIFATAGAVPYCAFDTRSRETWQEVLKWIVWALAPSLIAGYYFLLKPK
jgi:hypothetical protein